MLSSKEGFAAETCVWHQVGYNYFWTPFTFSFILLLFFLFFSLFVLLIPTCFTHCYLSHLPFILLLFFLTLIPT